MYAITTILKYCMPTPSVRVSNARYVHSFQQHPGSVIVSAERRCYVGNGATFAIGVLFPYCPCWLSPVSRSRSRTAQFCLSRCERFSVRYVSQIFSPVACRFLSTVNRLALPVDCLLLSHVDILLPLIRCLVCSPVHSRFSSTGYRRFF